MRRLEQDTVKNHQYQHERPKGQPVPVTPKKYRVLIQMSVFVPLFKRRDLSRVLHGDSQILQIYQMQQHI